MRIGLFLLLVFTVAQGRAQSPCNEPKLTVSGLYAEGLEYIRFQPSYSVSASLHPDCKTTKEYRVVEGKLSISRNGKLLDSVPITSGSASLGSAYGKIRDGDRLVFEIIKVEAVLNDNRIRTIQKNTVLSYTVKFL